MHNCIKAFLLFKKYSKKTVETFPFMDWSTTSDLHTSKRAVFKVCVG